MNTFLKKELSKNKIKYIYKVIFTDPNPSPKLLSALLSQGGE
ncbi:hypothetical protein [Lactobacillus helveticus]|nr:hypothetical protein [Lactobacillus helveticus]